MNHLFTFLRHSRRLLLWASVLLTVLVLSGWLLLQFTVLNDVDRYRPQVIDALANATGTRVEIGQLGSTGIGLLPVLSMDQITIYDPQGKPGLVLDHVQGHLSLWGLLRGRLDLSTLIIDQPTLTLRRAPDGLLLLSGIPLPRDKRGPSNFLDWLLNQGEIRITHARFTWLDDRLAAPPLMLQNGQIRIRNNGNRHRLEADFDPPDALATHTHLEADFNGSDIATFTDWRGNAVVHAERVDVAALKPWLPQLGLIERAHGSVTATVSAQAQQQWGVDVETDAHQVVVRVGEQLAPLHFEHLKGQLGFMHVAGGYEISTHHLTCEGGCSVRLTQPLEARFRNTQNGGVFSVNQLSAAQASSVLDMLPLSVEQHTQWNNAGLKGLANKLTVSWNGALESMSALSVQADLEGFSANALNALPAIHNFTGHVASSPEGGALKGRGDLITLNVPTVFQTPLEFQGYSIDAGWTVQGGNTRLTLTRLEVANADAAGYVTGTMTLGPDGPGESALSGELQRAQVAAVWRYLPLGISAGVRDWLHQSLQGGMGQHVTFQVKGDLQKFPFPQDKGGVFRVSADLMDARLRYDPAWPVITGIHGSLSLRGEQLFIEAVDGLILNSHIRTAHAHIPDLAHGDEHLYVQGEMEGTLSDALTFIVKSPVASYIHHVTDSIQGVGAGHLALDLHVPLRNPAATTVKGDYQFQDSTINDGDAGIPPVTQITGHLLFTERGVSSQNLNGTILAGSARFALGTLPGGDITLDASGVGDMTKLIQMYHEPVLADVSGKEAWQGRFLFTAKTTELTVDSKVAYLGEPVSVHLGTLNDGTVDLTLKGHSSAAALTRRYPNSPFKLLDSALDWNGHVALRSGHNDVSFAGAALVLQEPATVLITGSSPGVIVATASGHANVTNLHRLGYGWITDHAKGGFFWQARIERQGDEMRSTLTSPLVGVGVDLPAPFNKRPREPLLLQVRTEATDNGSTRVNLALGNWLGVEAWAISTPKGGMQIQRGVVNIGGPAKAVSGEGVSVTGRVAHTDLSAWQKLITINPGTAKESAPFVAISHVDVALEDVRWAGRTWALHQIKANQEGDHWNVQSHGSEVEGDFTWTPAENGRLKGHFTHLTIPVASSSTGVVEPVLDEQEQNMPSVDVIADQFSALEKPLGRLQLVALREGTVWRVERVALSTPEATLEGDGRWTGGASTQTQFNLHLKATDLGKLLNNLGYPKTLVRTKGDARGQLSWRGNPTDFAIDKTSGMITLDLHDGQFSKVEPGGAGRLIGLLSLQNLPRRITLDFHDFFSDGFGFDSLTGNFVMDHGVLSTRDFDMNGPAARVLLSGKINILEETTQLRARVSPAVGGSVSLATTLIGGPVAGVATYLLQKLLKNPLDKALTYEYSINGSWDDPVIQTVSAGSASVPANSAIPEAH
jgi:uncharacterized protein YhdP